jgi:hypothetical protein
MMATLQAAAVGRFHRLSARARQRAWLDSRHRISLDSVSGVVMPVVSVCVLHPAGLASTVAIPFALTGAALIVGLGAVPQMRRSALRQVQSS